MPKGGGKKLKIRVNKTAAVKRAEPVRAEFDGEKVEQEKRLFMWVGVSCVMAVIFIIWIFNLKYQFAANTDKSGRNNFNWEQTKAELDKAMAQIKQGISEIKQTRETEPTPEQIDALKGKLLGETAMGTASSTIK
ncbi:hypothetical protein GW814_00800 [Candidatus Falkowbacteria bacterium]|nr:hypothetical protein [Candidatus Falkowbacteria bacterium]OIP81368.1 MAG: hypothetical protein AUK20_00485 [Parcubacteria group bacterium CG2_30_45_37]